MSPAPPVGMSPAHTATTIFYIVFAAFGVPLFAWSIRRAVLDRDLLPITCAVGGAISALWEAPVDVMWHVWYPIGTAGIAYHAFGRAIPAFAPLGYSFYIGVGSYIVFRLLRRGVSRRTLWLLFAAATFWDGVLEYPGLLSHVYTYYGHQGLQIGGYPWVWAFNNAAIPLLGGWMLVKLAPRLAGPRALLALAVMPAACGGGVAIAGWPIILAINASTSMVVVQIASAGTALLSAAIAWGVIDSSAQAAPAVAAAAGAAAVDVNAVGIAA